ncbi:MAG: hypothetical protein ACUVTX_02565 [Bacteroidales bacterium]
MMKYNLKYYFTILILSLHLLCFHSGAQPYSYTDIENKLKEYVRVSPWEEIFVHIDRLHYIAGEDIWLSVYTLDRETGLLSDKSIAAYIELLNPWNNPVIQMRIGLDKGIGGGNIFLPDTLSPGNYTIRVYTSWMKNFMPDNCFMQNISVYNPFKNSGFKRKVFTDNLSGEMYSMKYYPEGGKLVSNVPNKVVVRLVDRYGRGVASEVVVKDNLGFETVSFTTGEYGFGSFILTPEKGKSYFALVEKLKFSLPVAADDGISLITDNSRGNEIEITINAAGIYASTSAGSYHILVQQNGKISYMTEVLLSGKVTRAVLPRAVLGKGVSQITVFGNDLLPLACRLIYNFLPGSEACTLSLKPEYGRRETVLATLNCGGMSERTARVSVTVIPAWQASYLQVIEDYMVFGSEFGITPWYENGNNINSLNPDLVDNFLISTYSRWMKWEEILSGKPLSRPYLFEKYGYYTYGLVWNRDTGRPDSSVVLYLSVPGKNAGFRYAVTDRVGRFNFLLPADNTIRKLIIQPADTARNIVLEVESPFLWKVPGSVCFTDSIPDAQFKQVSELSFNYQAARIYVTKFKKEVPYEEDRSVPVRRFYGIPELEVRLDDYIKLPVMQEVFFELVPGVRFRERRSGYEIRVFNPFNNIFYDRPPLTLIDGVVVQNASVIAGLDPETVERIEVVKTMYLIGDLYFYGIVNVITRRGDFRNIVLPDYAVEMHYRPFDISALFMPPDYSDVQKKNIRIPDLRNTLYWNPLVKPDEKEELKFKFPTHDHAGEYVINVQGVYESGRPFSISIPFIIK